MREFTFKEIVEELVQLIGPTLTALSSGAVEHSTVEAWLNGLEPEVSQEERLRFALEVLSDVAELNGNDVARAWFIGASCQNFTTAPFEAIRTGYFNSVRNSARRFINDDFS